MLSTSAAKGLVRPHAMTPFGLPNSRRMCWIQKLSVRSPTIKFYKLSCSHRLNMESQSRSIFPYESEKWGEKYRYHTPEIRVRNKAEYIRRVGTSFSLPGNSGSASSHVGAPLRLHKVCSIKRSASTLVSQLMCSISLVVSARRPPWLFLTTRTADNIQLLSLPADLGRMYVNMVANMVCISLCYRSHGEGEDPTVSSPTEPVGRR